MRVRSLPLAAAAALFALSAAAQTPPAGTVSPPAPGQSALGAAQKQPAPRRPAKQPATAPGQAAATAASPAAIRSQTETDRLYDDIMRRSDPSQ